MGNKMSVLAVFQSVFLVQAIAGGKPIEQIKYIDMALDFGNTGIGSILVQTARIRDIFAKVGWKVYNSGDSIGKYPRTMLEKYFNLQWKPDDAEDGNTATVHQANSSAVYVTYAGAHTAGHVGTEVLKEEFLKEIKEYTDAVFGTKKMLGVLIRGTDYIAADLPGKQKQAACKQMFPMIHEWLDQYHYDGIFLATEDADVMNSAIAEFEKKVKIVSQERFRVSDFKDVKLIAQLEKEKYKDEEEREEHIEDTMVNYLYAMYAVSRCESFICSGWSNGAGMVRSFNGGRFVRDYQFSAGQ